MQYLEYRDFLESLRALKNKGQSYSRPYDKVFQTYIRGKNASSKDNSTTIFVGLRTTDHGENRIEHAVKYDLGRGCRLVTIMQKGMCIFLFAGTHDDEEKWLDSHRGFKVVIEKQSGRIQSLQRSVNGVIDQRPSTQVDIDGFNLIEQLNQDDQDFLLEGGTPNALMRIFQLSSMSSDDEILNAVELMGNGDKCDALIDVLLHLRQKKNREKVSRILDDLRGQYIEFAEADNDLIELSEGGDEIIALERGDPEAIKIILESADYRSWMLYMHPDQKQIVDRDFNGPSRLQGVSGSGKTAVVVNRAIRLARLYPDQKIAVLTLNKALAKLIEDLVGSAAGVLDNLVVKSFWQLCIEQLNIFEPHNDRHYDEVTWKSNETIQDVWQEFYHQETNNNDADVMFSVHQSLLLRSIYPEEYIKEEFDFIRSALPTDRRSDYLEMEREGRSIPLTKPFRKLLLKGLSVWEKKMKDVGVVDYLGVTSALYQHLDKIEPVFRSILVDEVQDFGTLELELIRKMVGEGENDLFLAGDTVQRVHTKQHDFKKAGINIVGRSLAIKQNYRNSREILEAAHSVLMENLTSDQFTSTIDVQEPEYAEYHDVYPYILRGKSVSDEVTSAIQYLHEMLKDAGPGHNGCVAVAGYHLSELDDLAAQLGIQLLNGEIDLKNESIFLSDLEQTKGFEFDHMIIVACSKGVLPNPNLPVEEAYRDLSRFYVAMTRAKRNLIVSYSGEISQFLTHSTGYFLEDEWSNHIVNRNYIEITAPCANGRLERFQSNEDEYGEIDYKDLTGKQLLLTRRAIGMKKERQDRLLKYITGVRKKAQHMSSRSWLNLGQLFEEKQLMVNQALAGGSENVLEEVNYFKNRFLSAEEESVESGQNSCSIRDTSQESRWSVSFNSGKCRHCGGIAMPGDDTCYRCNPS